MTPGNLSPQFDQGVLIPNQISLREAVIKTVSRTKLDVVADTNVNPGAAAQGVAFTVTALDELALVPAGFDIPLTVGDYEVSYALNFTSTSARPNMATVLNFGGAVLETVNGHNYIRASTGHNEASQTATHAFTVAVAGNLRIDVLRQAGAGAVAMPSGWMIVRKYEDVTVLVP